MGEEKQIAERRKFERQEVPIPCVVFWQGCPSEGKIMDISPVGAFISDVNSLPETGTRIQIRLPTYGKPEVRLPARVVHGLWSGAGWSFGVNFEESPETIKRKLTEILDV